MTRSIDNPLSNLRHTREEVKIETANTLAYRRVAPFFFQTRAYNYPTICHVNQLVSKCTTRANRTRAREYDLSFLSSGQLSSILFFLPYPFPHARRTNRSEDNLASERVRDEPGRFSGGVFILYQEVYWQQQKVRPCPLNYASFASHYRRTGRAPIVRRHTRHDQTKHGYRVRPNTTSLRFHVLFINAQYAANLKPPKRKQSPVASQSFLAFRTRCSFLFVTMQRLEWLINLDLDVSLFSDSGIRNGACGRALLHGTFGDTLSLSLIGDGARRRTARATPYLNGDLDGSATSSGKTAGRPCASGVGIQ